MLDLLITILAKSLQLGAGTTPLDNSIISTALRATPSTVTVGRPKQKCSVHSLVC